MFNIAYFKWLVGFGIVLSDRSGKMDILSLYEPVTLLACINKSTPKFTIQEAKLHTFLSSWQEFVVNVAFLLERHVC